MKDEMITPVNHTGLSAFSTTAGHTVGGGLKTGAKAALGWIAAFAVGGALLGLALSTGGFAALGAMLAGQVAGTTLGGVIAATVGGGLIAGVIGAYTSLFPATLGAIFGAGKGAMDGSRRVREEKGAAAMLDAQIEYARAASAAAQTNVYTAPLAANENKFNFPAQGSALNAAASTVQANGIQRDGVVDNLALQRA